MSEHKRDVHGHTVSGEDDALNGINYLDHHLDYQEAEVFFDQAKRNGAAQFEDDKKKNYTIIRNQDATYTVERRKESGGWF
ncbi:MAG: hypothetical protein COY66_05645 [Candidatus Kerfeldbacteria bacterium CG_4_10_14_0_8_um_filter_42_10]|uniref:Uncharacterized protein n=1 Tax=Candidatus Kerfeldbacteria bacterium CG_4_10_14_0_8_um_filter_42_10 TaxID=2014248 RepID=A0A2M7RH55_9BACT|nr:MAG: hypothetical protein COY66_05645 [Candidatus Kerfeldbacteria bacterium CG_4_10_14_0_8_um_filter_42_10]